ncbi:hypothetical protein H9Q72_012164 [Fusarium xylarioides]|uniref:Uncharacterized protein n=1 Tax=Fusarium xylarioides TaxID=221167 RepID=A0A9P7HHJ5_9HYPO|nr:hypothetical protein H9Q72_012164 [Fusarium xylarioides]
MDSFRNIVSNISDLADKMSLPRADKLSLMVRKNVRDQFEQEKPNLEAKLSKALLGVSWTIDVDPLSIYPYAESSYARNSFGSMLNEYISRATTCLDWSQESIKSNVNTLASAHVLTIEVDPSATFKYCSCDIKDGKLRILVAPTGLGSNISEAVADNNLKKALNDASISGGNKLSFVAEEGLAKYWYPSKSEIEAKVAKILGQPVKLDPRLEENYAALKAESEEPGTTLIKHWENNFGNAVHGYFNGLVSQLESQKFPGDDMLQEGFFDVVSKAEIALRTVSALKKGNYNESVVEDGVLYLQTTPGKWATNVQDAGANILDLL